MDLKKFLQHHQAPNVHQTPGFKPLEALKKALERDLSLVQRMTPPLHPMAHLMKIWFAGSPEDGGQPYVFLQIPGQEGLLFELGAAPQCLLLRARLVNPIVETPLSRERKPLIIRQPQTAQVFTLTSKGDFESPSGAVLTADDLSEALLETAVEALMSR